MPLYQGLAGRGNLVMGTVVKGTVFILQSRHHGSNQQLVAIAKSIFPEHTVMRQRFELRSRSKLFRLFCRLLVRLKRSTGGIRPFAAVLSWLALRHGYVRVTDRDVIIAKTPPFEYPAMILGAGTGARTVFLGAPRHFSTRDFDTVVSTPSTFCADADIVLETLPTEVYGAPAKATMPDRTSTPVWSLIVGGDAKGYHYGEEFFRLLCQEMERLSRALGIQWIVSTSPRTGATAETTLMAFARQHPEWVDELVVWGRGDRSGLRDLLGRSDTVLITEDSASMVSEAVNQRLRTVCLRPEGAGFNSLITPLLESLERNQRVLRVDLGQLSGLKARDLMTFEFRSTALIPKKPCCGAWGSPFGMWRTRSR